MLRAPTYHCFVVEICTRLNPYQLGADTFSLSDPKNDDAIAYHKIGELQPGNCFN